MKLIYLFLPVAMPIFEDAFLMTPQILEKYGYPCETHNIITDDGYILTHFRILFGKNNTKKIPVILQHGLFATSAQWTLKPFESLSYQLADENYDVWLINSRGGEHSLKHKFLNSSIDEEFWNYSLHEIGFFDLAATIDYILNLTNSKQLFHIGHSQGTTAVYVLLSEKPEYNEKFIAHISYAPVAFLNHATSPFMHFFANFERNFNGLTTMRAIMGDFNIIVMSDELKYAITEGCADYAPMQMYCLQTFDAFSGKNPSQMNSTMVPVMFGHFFVSSSLKQLIHFIQLHVTGLFNQFNYGSQINMKKYSVTTAPNYKFKNILVPIYTFYGNNDALVDPLDAEKTSNFLPNLQQSNNLGEWSHSDFYFGNDIATKLHVPTLEILKQHVKNIK